MDSRLVDYLADPNDGAPLELNIFDGDEDNTISKEG